MAFLAIAPWLVNLLIVGFLFICVMLVLIVLIQRPQGGGLAGAFGAGSGGAGQTAFGTKTGDALTLATIALFVLYLLVAIGLIFAARPQNIGPGRGAAITSPETPGSPAVGGPAEGAEPDPTAVIPSETEPAEVPVEDAPVDAPPIEAPESAPTEVPSEVPTGAPAGEPVPPGAGGGDRR